jgi:glycine cleavage system aminomethyltransferase T/glycine/D-amino acid oxidase-like deaminating enzyme
MPKPIPTHAQVVVIGGGIVGCSVAYHLTKQGWTDVVLLERRVLTCGTTWAAAGLCAQIRATRPLTKLAVYGTELYARLESETDQATGYETLGTILCAQTRSRTQEYERLAAMGRSFGIEMHRISPEEARQMYPLLETGDLEAIFYCPNDGVTNPVDTTQALARGARMGGAQIYENVEVTDIQLTNNTVKGVSTTQGKIQCEYVVNCAGMWGRKLGEMVGVSLPLHAAEHMHIVTKPIEGVYRGLPTMRDMDGYIYFREEVGGLLMGGFEPVAKPWGMRGIPDHFQFTELNEDWDQFEIFMKNAIKRVPAMETAQVRHLTVVPESFTPDGVYMLGEAPGVVNYFVACGMNSLGIASAGGAGKALAEWIVAGAPTEDLWDVDVRRCFPWQNNARYLNDRIKETVGLLYADHWPFRQYETARPVRCSAIHDRLATRGACFGAAFGWERANWFAVLGMEPQYEYSWGRQNWFDCSAAEHMAVRKGVGLYDLSSMAQFLLQGKDVLPVLQGICSNDVDVPMGKVVYTQFLNDRGGIEADVTVTRLAEDTYFIVTAGANEIRDFDWLKRNIPSSAHATLTNVSSGYTMLGVMGPDSRKLLSTLTDADLTNTAFPFATARYIDLGYAKPLALRMSYVGELGWELYIPPDFATGVFDTLMEEGSKLGLKLVGLHAVDSLRLEKGYRHWGSDIGPDDTPYEAGLGFCVKLDKGDFMGRDALVRQREKGLTRKLAIFTLEDPGPLLYHDEPIYRNGELVSRNTHGAYAHYLGCAMGMGYLENPEGISDEWIMSGNYEIDVEGTLYSASVHINAPYDPEGQRVQM